LGYLIISWILFFIAGEKVLVNNIIDFVYFAVTTASTIGYGDMSPSTPAGRLIAALWFFPGALLIFATSLSKLTQVVITGLRRVAEGRGNYANVRDATVIIGYDLNRTTRMVRNLVAGRDDDDTIIVMTSEKDVNLPDGVFFVHCSRLDSQEDMERAGVGNAAKVLIYASSDGEAFNACLAVREINADVHIAAYFDDRDTAKRAERLARIDAIVSTSTEMLVRAAQDPGAGTVLMALSSATEKSTIFSAEICIENTVLSGELSSTMLGYGATMVAIATEEDHSPQFAPFAENLSAGSKIYYISSARFDRGIWKKIVQEAQK
jgi:voltage-gated potassium channel